MLTALISSDLLFMYLRSNPLTMNIFLSLLTDTFLKTFLEIFSQPFYRLIHDPVNRLLADTKFFCNLVLVHAKKFTPKKYLR